MATAYNPRPFKRIEFTLEDGRIIGLDNPAITSVEFSQWFHENFAYDGETVVDRVECTMVFNADSLYHAMQSDPPALPAPDLRLEGD